MFRTGVFAGTVVIAALAAAMTLTTLNAAEADQQRDQERARSAEETKVFTGLVVDLYHYLNGENADNGEIDDAEIAGESTGGPAALLIKEEGVISTTTELRVLVFESRDDANQFQSRISGMIGERARISGYAAERDGVAAVTVKEMREHTPESDSD